MDILKQNIGNFLTRYIQVVSAFTQVIIRDGRKRLLKQYADWRVGARIEELRNTDERIVLTFDDYGSESEVTELLDILAEHKVRAAFFVQGDWADKAPGLVRKIAKGGHIVGDHTYSHPDLLSLTDAEILAEIGRVNYAPFLRPPCGRYNARVRSLVRSIGYSIKYWSIDSDDWQGISAEEITRAVLRQLHHGAVILFHLHAAHTREALPGIISEIRRRGYKLAEPGERLWGQP